MSSSDSAERRLPTLVLQKALLRRNSLQRNDNETASAKDVISSGSASGALELSLRRCEPGGALRCRPKMMSIYVYLIYLIYLII